MVAPAVSEPADQRPGAVAEALIAEYPGCVDSAEQDIAMAYQMRRLSRTLDTQTEQLAHTAGPKSAAAQRYCAI